MKLNEIGHERFAIAALTMFIPTWGQRVGEFATFIWPSSALW